MQTVKHTTLAVIKSPCMGVASVACFIAYESCTTMYMLFAACLQGLLGFLDSFRYFCIAGLCSPLSHSKGFVLLAAARAAKSEFLR